VPAVRARWVQRPLHWVDQPVPARRSPAKEPVAERLLRRAPPTRWAVREGEQRPARAVRAAAAAALVEALRLRLRAARVDVLLVDKAAVQERACPQNSTCCCSTFPSVSQACLGKHSFLSCITMAPKVCLRAVLRSIQDGFVHDADEVLAILRENGTFFEFSLCLSRACLGKIMHVIYKRLKKCRFLT
jgi:hypothetical protein